MTMMHKDLLLLVLSVAALVLASVWMLAPWASSGGAFVYEVAEVSRGPICKLVATSGPVRALVTVSVGSQLSGQVHDLKVNFNSEVKVGEELAIIDDKTFVAKVALANAGFMAARATMLNHEAVERNAGRLMERQQTLASKGTAATTTLDVSTRDAEVARPEIEVAKAQLENAKAPIAQRESQFLQTRIDLDRTRIRSPFEGTVIGRTVDVGPTVPASLQAPELFNITQLVGLIGVVLGAGAAFVMPGVADWLILIAPQMVLLAMAAAAVAGILLGFLPARRAALLNPIDALRSE